VILLLLVVVAVVEPGQWCLEGGRYQEPRTVTLQYWQTVSDMAWQS